MSHTAPLLHFTLAPPLTVDNILTAVQGVAWRSLGEKLFFKNEGYLDEIEQQYQSDGKRLDALIEHWLQGEGYDEPSWRALIYNLDYAEESRITDTIRHYAEPVSGESCVTITLFNDVNLSSASFSVYSQIHSFTHSLC